MKDTDSIKETPPDDDQVEEKSSESQKDDVADVLDVTPDDSDDTASDENSIEGETVDDDDVDPLAFQCKQCKDHFTSNENLLKHQLTAHRSKSKSCKLCRRIFFDKNDLLEHEAKHKTGKQRLYKCSMCPRHFFNDRLLAEHETKHEQAGAVFLKKRMSGPRTNHSFKVRCDVCKKEFMSKLRFRKHNQEGRCNTSGDQWSYFCVVCQSIVDREVKESKSHFCRPQFACNDCKQTLTSKNRLVNHIKKYHSKPGGPKEVPSENYCLQCDEHFNSAEEYEKHNQDSKHNILNLISCEICSSMFTNERNLRLHKQRHEAYLATCKYICRYCQARFKVPRKLLGHYAGTHSKERPYKCEQCTIDFQTKNKFAAHIRTDHKGDGKIKFLKDFSIIFTPNPVPQSAAPAVDNVELVEPVLEVGATETVETSENIAINEGDNQGMVVVVPPPTLPSIVDARHIIIRPMIKTISPLSAMHIKTAMDNKLDIGQKVIIKKISEDEAKVKKQMVFRAVPIKTCVEANDTTYTEGPPSTHYDEVGSPNVCDEYSNDGGNDDFQSYSNDDNEIASAAPKESLVLVSSNPLQNLINQQLLEESKTGMHDSGAQTKQMEKSVVSVILNTLMAAAASQQQDLMGSTKKPKTPKASKAKEFDYLSIIKNSLAVDADVAKKKEIIKQEKVKKIPKPKYQPKQYDYLSIITNSLKEDEAAVAAKQAKAKAKEKLVKPKKEKSTALKYQPKQYNVEEIIERTLKSDIGTAKPKTGKRKVGRPKSKAKPKTGTKRKKKGQGKKTNAKKMKFEM